MSKNTHGTAAGVASRDPGGDRVPSTRAHLGWAIPRPADSFGPAAGSQLQAGRAARTACGAAPGRPPARSRLGAAAVAAVALAAAGILTAAAGAAPPPLGDQAAIGYYHDRADAYSKIPGAEIVESGYFFVRSNGGSSVDYAWGNGRPAGYVPATGTIVARLAGGQIVAYLARIRAPHVPTVRVVMSGGSVYSSTSDCWRKVTASASPLGTGTAFVLNDGGARFLPLRTAGSSTTTTFTYTWVPGASATETSVFGPHDPSAFKVTVVVKGKEAMVIHKSVTPLHAPPKLPVAPPPGQPAPKPLCAV
jgi:hypothetical protein